MEFLNKPVHLIEPQQLLRMFVADCLILPREPKRVPLAALDKLLGMYCRELEVVKPSSKMLATEMRRNYQESRIDGAIHFVCAIRPKLINQEDK